MPNERPNILYIMSDDHASHAMSCYGSRINQTPNLDSIADEGMRFDNCFSTDSICTPSRAVIVRKGNAIYFSSPIFTQYYHLAPQWCRTLFLNASNILLPESVVRHHGPSTLEVTLDDQETQGRLVLHLLHYIPIRRSKIDIIEDVIPIYDVAISVRADKTIQSVKLAPSGHAIDFDISDGRINFTVTEVKGHQMIELNYQE